MKLCRHVFPSLWLLLIHHDTLLFVIYLPPPLALTPPTYRLLLSSLSLLRLENRPWTLLILLFLCWGRPKCVIVNETLLLVSIFPGLKSLQSLEQNQTKCRKTVDDSIWEDTLFSNNNCIINENRVTIVIIASTRKIAFTTTQNYCPSIHPASQPFRICNT